MFFKILDISNRKLNALASFLKELNRLSFSFHYLIKIFEVNVNFTSNKTDFTFKFDKKT